MEKVVKGKITKITNFGAFMAIEGGKSGMIHISEISQSFVKNIHDFLKEGQEIEAAIISEDENGRLALSLKRLIPKAAPKVTSGPPDDFYSPRKGDDKSFEAMMTRFKSVSDEKICDLKKGYDGKRGKNTKKTKH
ncbi:MAG: S1 RNA-binding domain-containing protein [Eubacteriales bacterium]|nr:S1 RNA-binding domain-containing protein [Eubacteriales bacterium]